MLVGLVGSPLSGKSTLAAYLKANHNFEIVNMGSVDHMTDYGLIEEPSEQLEETKETTASSKDAL